MMTNSFFTAYQKLTKNRAKCRKCGRLIGDGERVYVEQWHREAKDTAKVPPRIYKKTFFWHESCSA